MTVLPHTVTLQRVSTSVDADGGKAFTWATRTSGIACLITQQSATGPAGQSHTVTFPSQTDQQSDIMVGDRLLISTGPGFTSGLYFAVNGITQHGGVGRIDAYTRLQCRQVLESWTPGGQK